MWYLILGNSLSLVTYFVYFNYFCKQGEVNMIEFLFGWFFLEHVFDQYHTTAGKLFLTYDDFRCLIKNVLLLIRNLLFLAQLFPIIVFVVVHVVLLTLINQCRVKNILIGIYFFSFNLFLFDNLIINIKMLNYPFTFYLIIITLVVYAYIFYYNTFYSKISNFNYKFLTIKCVFYLFLASKFLFIIFWCFSSYFYLNENFLQEFVLSSLILYVYTYYFSI